MTGTRGFYYNKLLKNLTSLETHCDCRKLSLKRDCKVGQGEQGGDHTDNKQQQHCHARRLLQKTPMTAAIPGDVMRFGDGATEAVGVSLSRALTEEVVPAVAVVQAAVSVTSVTRTV